MFTALHTLAQRATLHIMAVAEGDQLRLTVQPKPTGKNAPVPPALSLLASPEEFDRDFVKAVAEYQAPVMTLLDQTKAAVKAVSETKPAEDDAAKPRATKKPKTAAASKKPAAPAKVVKSVNPAVAKKPPVAKKAAKQTIKPTEPPPDKTALIQMARKYLGKLGAKKKASRADFIKKFKHGRRYERLFTNFEELLAAAGQQSLPLNDLSAAPGTLLAGASRGISSGALQIPEALREHEMERATPETVGAQASPAAVPVPAPAPAPAPAPIAIEIPSSATADEADAAEPTLSLI